jgi:4-hydroxyphenylpyruvate dioxygenase
MPRPEHLTELPTEHPTTRSVRVHGYDAVSFWVGNARQAAHLYRSAFGFELTAYAGPETGVRDRAAYVLEQGDLRFVVVSGLRPDHEIVRHHARHGDGIRDVAFRVDDAERAFATAVDRGATPALEPESREDEHGKVVVAAIRTYGDTIHSFVQRHDYGGPYLPGFAPVDAPRLAPPVGLTRIDHVVGNVEVGAMGAWAAFYERVFGLTPFHHFTEEDIATEDTALTSTVLRDGVGTVTLPINEPAEGRRRSQIAEFLDAYDGPGIQHLALATDDIVGTVRALRHRGIGFLPVPRAYYDEARRRVGPVEPAWDDLAALGILVDRDAAGYLLQIFTEPLQDRPTVFFELIQREGATGFGAGNFKALFASIERAQARRGNL